MKESLSILAAVLLAVPVAAQTYIFVPSDTPAAGGCNVIPFGTVKTDAIWVNQRYQTIVPASVMGNQAVTICSLAFAACTQDQTRSMDEVTITMAQTTNTVLNPNFASNLTTRPTVVLQSKCHIWNPRGNAWSNIGLQRTFLYIPAQGNLVIEVCVNGNDRKDSTRTTGFRSYAGERNYRFRFTGSCKAQTMAQGRDAAAALKMRIGVAQPSLDNYGMGCGPGPLAIAGSGTGQINTSVGATLTGGPAAGAGLIWIGFGKIDPIDLSGIGCQGCKVNCLPVVAVGQAFQNGRSNGIKILLPNDRGLACAQLCLQGLAIQQHGNCPFAISDCLRILVGL